MLTGMYLEDIDFNLAIARKNRDLCKVTIGVHPYHAAEAEEGGDAYFEKLTRKLEDTMKEESNIVGAFGELGLDYDRLDRASKDIQVRIFKRQLDLVIDRNWQLPLFLHCRAAFDDFIAIISSYISMLPMNAGIVHSFVGTAEQMRQLVALGLHVSVNNFAFKDRESLEMIRQLPLDKLQIETDAPWGEIQASSEVAKAYLRNAQAWKWKTKKKDKFELGCMVKERNESCAIAKVAMIVAGLKGVAVNDVAEASWRNAREMFFKE